MSVDVKYRTTASATGGRDGRAATEDGSLDVKLSTPKELGGAGLGHAILPGMAWRDSDAPRLSARSLAPRLERQLALVLRRDKPRHPGLREMLRALEACFASRGGR